MNDSFSYPGKELELFEKATNWKRYFSSFIKPILKGEVLEAGPGLGSNTLLFYNDAVTKWTLLEPDPGFSALLQKKVGAHELPSSCKVVNGTLFSLPDEQQFDAIIYIDVLEHIEEDKKEIERACRLLRPGGSLVILSPAFQFVYSRFDKTIGHYRRYTKRSLKKIIPPALSQAYVRYLDSTGLLLSMTNRFLLRQEYPTQKQVNFWDKVIIPFSRIADRIVFYSFGKTILGSWKKPL